MVLSGRRIAVTGASGLVGRHLLPVLSAAGHTWTGQARRLPDGTPPPGCGWCRADFGSWWTPEQLDSVFGTVDAIVHLAAALPEAAGEPARMMDVNVRACLAIGEWALARGIPLIHVSSSVVYGQTDSRCAETMPRATAPMGGLYGLTKSLAEMVFDSLAARGLHTVILRPSSLYGYGLADDKLVPKFLALAARGETIHLSPPVEDAVNFVHATDLARAILATLDGAPGTYNVASPAMTTMAELAHACVAVTGKGRVSIEPGQASRAAHHRFDLDVGAIAAEVNFAPIVSLTTGLKMVLGKSVTLSGDDQ